MFDIHCHIVPEVDDGSRSMEESIDMLREAKSSGIDRIVCTPHCRSTRFDRARIERQFSALQDRADLMGIRLDLGFEVHWKQLAEMGIEAAPRLCLGQTNLMLLEFSCSNLPANWQRVLYEVQSLGVRIVIAHPERYQPVQRDLDVAYEMKELGCLLQLSGNFAQGGFLDRRRKTALALLKGGLVDYIASDAHRPQDYETYRKALRIASKY